MESRYLLYLRMAPIRLKELATITVYDCKISHSLCLLTSAAFGLHVLAGQQELKESGGFRQ